LALLTGNGVKWFENTSESGCAIYGGQSFDWGRGMPPLQTAESRWRKNVYNKRKSLLVSVKKFLTYSAKYMEI
jgi:hypothetical protein